MQALRLARPTAAPLRRSLITRSLVTTASPHLTAATASASSPTTSAKSQQSIIPLSNVEAQWEKLSKEDQLTVHEQLEALQKKDWKTLSIDEKKAGVFLFSFSFFMFPSCISFAFASWFEMEGSYAYTPILFL
jgi:cytochrome c oxidase subunit 4